MEGDRVPYYKNDRKTQMDEKDLGDEALPEREAPLETPELEGGADAEGAADEKTRALEAKIAELNDQYLRKAADFENFRKRMLKEKQEAIDFANQNLLLDLIPVLDDFERAAAAGGGGADVENLREGIMMIQQRLLSTLENKWGLKRFDSKDAVFDPSRHEALMMEKSAEVLEAVVQEDLIKGYTLKDRVIRAAKVKVLMPE